MWDNCISTFTGLPEYIKGGIVTLAVTVIAGIILAYISTRVFQRISEVTRIKGILTERRIEVYKELANKLEKLDNLRYFHSDQVAYLTEPLKDIGITIDVSAGVKVNEIFTSMDLLHEKFLEFDNYALENRIFYDEAVYNEITFLQNYFGLYAHIRILFEEVLFESGPDVKSEVYKNIADKLLLTCGMILSNDFSQQILKSVDVIRTSMNDVSLKTRKSHRHTYDYFNDPNGPIMKKIKASGFDEKLTDITKLVIYYAEIAASMKPES